jgi:hypothetical protein
MQLFIEEMQYINGEMQIKDRNRLNRGLSLLTIYIESNQ